MKNNLFLLFLTLSIFAHSCQKEQIIESVPLNGEYKIALDSLSTFESEMIQYVSIDSQEYLLVLNEFDNSIYFYHYPSGELEKKIKFEKRGEQGVGLIMSFLWHNKDSIFLLNSNRNNLLVNKNHEILKQISIIDIAKGPTEFSADPILTSTTRPMQLIGQNLYMNGVFIGRKKIKPMNLVGFQTGISSTFYHYPNIETYANDLMLENSYYLYSHIYNSNKRYFVFSFAADDSLRITNFTDLNFSVNASTQIIGQIDPYLEEGKEYTDEEYKLVYLTKKYYTAIIYDPYKDQYYRFFENSASQQDLESPTPKDDFHLKQVGFIVLDVDFNPIKTILLSKATYNTRNIFVTNEGLCILNQKKCMENEDMMYYDIFDL
jgi:WD40 repeat protein